MRRRDLKFVVRDKMFLKVKGVLRFGRKGNLSLCFIRLFGILEWIGHVPYRLALLSSQCFSCLDVEKVRDRSISYSRL